MNIDFELLPTIKEAESRNNRRISSVFYQKLRQEITSCRLIEMANLAERIPLPDVFGQYATPHDFFQTLRLVLNSTEETRRRGYFLLKILRLLEKKENLLDVGSGDAKILKWVGNKFKKITAIDINEEALVHIKRAVKKTIKLTTIHQSIIDVQLEKNTFDFSILSHLLYYLPLNEWMRVVENVYDVLRVGGIMVIILSGERHGKAQLIKDFGGNPIAIDYLLKQCHLLAGMANVQSWSSDEFFLSLTLRGMLHIAGFMLYDAGSTASLSHLQEYVIKHYRLAKNQYIMSSQQQFIVIFKA